MTRCWPKFSFFLSLFYFSVICFSLPVQAQEREAKVIPTKFSGSSTSNIVAPSASSTKSFQLNEEGVALIFEGKRADGKKKIEEAISLDPNNATALYNVAGLLLSEGQTDKAIATMKQAVAIEENEPAFLNRLAEAYFAANNLDMAIATYERLAQSEPTYDLTLLRLASLYSMKRDWDKAETTFKQAIRLNLADRRVLHGLGSILVAKGQYNEALTFLKEAQLEQKTPETEEAIAVAYEGLASWDKAAEHYRKTLALSPEREDIKEKLKQLEEMGGK